MPDNTGRLSFEEQIRINAKFSELEDQHLGDMVCTLCGGIKWVLAEYITLMPVAGKRGALTGRSIPSVTYYCDNCGHMHFFAAAFFEVYPTRSEAELEEGEDVQQRA